MKVLFMQKGQNVTPFCKAFKSLLSSHLCQRQACLLKHYVYASIILGYSIVVYLCLPLKPTPWGQKLGLLHLCAPVLSSGINLRRGVFSHPITGVWTVRPLISRWRNEVIFLTVNVSWEFIVAIGINRKQKTHSLKAVLCKKWDKFCFPFSFFFCVVSS